MMLGFIKTLSGEKRTWKLLSKLPMEIRNTHMELTCGQKLTAGPNPEIWAYRFSGDSNVPVVG